MKPRRACCLIFSFGFCAAIASVRAAVLPAPVMNDIQSWHLPGRSRAILVTPEKSITAHVVIPPLSEKEVTAGGTWRGVLSVDVLGTPNGKPGKIHIEAFDRETKKVFAESDTTIVDLRAPQAAWWVIASSEHPGSEAANAVDGDPNTQWHSRYGAAKAAPPHWLGIGFSKPQTIQGARLLPRQSGYTNGVPRRWRLETQDASGAWMQAARGESNQNAVAKNREPITVLLDAPQTVTSFRFLIDQDWSGGGFGTAAEVMPLGITLEEPPLAEESLIHRAWVEIPAPLLERLEGTSFGLRIAAENNPVVCTEPRWCRVNTTPSRKLFGRSNGGLGPDKLGAGLFGFTALTEQNQTILTVMDVQPDGPAAQAGLQAGDAIVAVAGLPLPVNDLNPGWTWFEQSHEAILGRATETALQTGRKTIDLGVLRENRLVSLPVKLNRHHSFQSMNPADDAEAAALLEDLLSWTVTHQRPDGSWSGDIKRTTFAALALLASDDEHYLPLVRRAIDWSLQKFDSPEKHGNLGFWGGSYMGILYAEWHLRTGDDRVLPHLDAMRDWAFEGRHPSIWGVPALGHGPSGLPYGQKSLVAPACHLLVFESLARRCGMESRLWEMLMPYMDYAWSNPEEGGHGGLGYNKSYKDLGEFWSRSGLFAIACHLRGERPEMRDAMIAIMQKRHPWLRNSHAYGEPGGGLGLLALQLITPEIYTEIMQEYAWWFSLAWQPGYGLKFTTPHMGAPYMGEDDLLNPLYALVLQAPKRNLHLTGKSR